MADSRQLFAALGLIVRCRMVSDAAGIERDGASLWHQPPGPQKNDQCKGALRLRQLRQRIQLNAFVQAGAVDAGEVFAQRFGAGKVAIDGLL